MDYKYHMTVIRDDGTTYTFKSDNLVFLVDLGTSGLECGSYLSAHISEAK